MTNKTNTKANDILLVKEIKENPYRIIEEALTRPGTIAGCYSLFHQFSISNTVGFMGQLKAKGLPITPVMCSKDWVRKGFITEEKRRQYTRQFMYGLMPICKKYPARDDEGKLIKDEKGEQVYFEEFLGFKMAQAWLSSSQLGIEVKQPVEQKFDEQEVLNRLGLEMVEWGLTEGNAQGYAIPNKKQIAINPLCTKRVDTFLHEVAHCLLHSELDRVVDGKELDQSTREVEAELTSYVCLVMLDYDNEELLSNARGYIQNWLGKNEFKNFGRVYKAVNTIMKAIANYKDNFKATASDYQTETPKQKVKRG